MGGLVSILRRQRPRYEITTLCSLPEDGVCGALSGEEASALWHSCELCGAGREGCPEELAACRQCGRRVCLDCMGVCAFGRSNGPCMLCQLQDKYDESRMAPGSVIGQGASGKVYSCVDKRLFRWLLRPKEDLVVKAFDSESFGATDAACKEITAMWKIARCHTCEFILSARAIKLKRNAIWIVLPSMKMDLERLLETEAVKEKPYRSEHLIGVLPQVAEALSFMHKKGLIHCDVKPGNILINEVGGGYAAKLSDFDTCLSVNHIDCVYPRLAAHRVDFELWQGTKLYFPPEWGRHKPERVEFPSDDEYESELEAWKASRKPERAKFTEEEYESALEAWKAAKPERAEFPSDDEYESELEAWKASRKPERAKFTEEEYESALEAWKAARKPTKARDLFALALVAAQVAVCHFADINALEWFHQQQASRFDEFDGWKVPPMLKSPKVSSDWDSAIRAAWAPNPAERKLQWPLYQEAPR